MWHLELLMKGDVRIHPATSPCIASCDPSSISGRWFHGPWEGNIKAKADNVLARLACKPMHSTHVQLPCDSVYPYPCHAAVQEADARAAELTSADEMVRLLYYSLPQRSTVARTEAGPFPQASDMWQSKVSLVLDTLHQPGFRAPDHVASCAA